MQKLKQIWGLIKSSVEAFSEDDGSSMGAAIAYYTLFSCAPLLVITIAISGLVFGREVATGQVLEQMRALMGEGGAEAIQTLLEGASNPANSVPAAIGGAFILILGATTVFSELYGDLNRIWREPTPPKVTGILALIRTKLLSFGMILGIGFLLLVSLLISTALAAIGKWWGGLFTGWEIVSMAMQVIFSFLMITTCFAMIYKFLPRARIGWRDVIVGAAVTGMLFEIGKFLIGVYLGTTTTASTFGAAGSLVVLLIWVYYSAQIFLLGAEFTWVYTYRFGSRRDQSPPEQTPLTHKNAATTKRSPRPVKRGKAAARR